MEADLKKGKAYASTTDGSSVAWNGSVPTGPGFWSGANPVLPMAGTWKTWVLASGSELRPGPPPAYDSPQMAAEMDEVRAFQRTPQSNNTAYFWEYGAGGSRGYWYWSELLQRKVLEYGLVEEASESRIAAGIHTRSDVRVGRDLGWAVAQRVITLSAPSQNAS